MKEKIKARLKAKFSGVNLSQKRQDAIADKIAKKLSDDSDDAAVDEALDDYNEIFSFADIAKADDRSRTEEAKKKAEEEAARKKKDETPEPPAGDDTPAWAKTLIETNSKLTERLNALESGKTAELRRTTLEAKLKDVPEKLKNNYLKQFDRMSFKDDEDFNSFVAETETEAKELAQDFSNKSVGGFGVSKTGGTKNDKSEPAKEDVKAIVGDLMKN